MRTKYIYICIENSNREILPKLLISTEFLNNNFEIIIGNRQVLHTILKFLPKGAVLEKSYGYSLSKIVRDHFKYGHKVYALDEEALTIASKKQYMRLNYLKKNQKFLSKFFLSNKKQEEMLISQKVDKKKLYLSGTPKFEVYKKKYHRVFDESAKLIKKKHGKFILITSRFAHINPNLSELSDTDKLDPTYLHTSAIIFKKLISLTKKIAQKFKNERIIFRPHPSENEKKLKQIFHNYQNVKVVYEGNIAPWIISSKLLIHNRCSTGLEGLLLNKPVISYDPVDYNSIHDKFFKILGIRCETDSKVLEVTKKTLKKNITKKILNNKIFKKYVYLFEKNSPQKKIVNLIDKEIKPQNNGINLYDKIFLNSIGIKKNVSFNLDYLSGKERAKYQKQKFGKLNKQIIDQHMRLLLDIENRTFNIKIENICREVFLIKKR